MGGHFAAAVVADVAQSLKIIFLFFHKRVQRHNVIYVENYFRLRQQSVILARKFRYLGT